MFFLPASLHRYHFEAHKVDPSSLHLSDTRLVATKFLSRSSLFSTLGCLALAVCAANIVQRRPSWEILPAMAGLAGRMMGWLLIFRKRLQQPSSWSGKGGGAPSSAQ